MATVKKKKRGKKASKERSTEWVVRWFDPAGDRKMKSFATKGAADDFATTVENEKLRNDYRDPRLGKTPLGEFYESRWLPAARARMAPSTLGLMEGHWKRYVEPKFADRRLNSVTQFDLRSFCAAMVERASIYQAETSLRLLRSILRAAVEDGLLARSPADEVSAPRRPHHKNRYLTEEEVASLVAAHPERWRAFVLIAAYGGLRFGEIVGLRLANFDFFRRKLRVEEAIVESGGQRHQRPTKSGKMRTVTLPRFVVDALANHMKQWPPGQDSLIFSDDDGEPIWRYRFYKQVWWPALKRAGVGDVRFHDLRHTSAALAIAAGAHAKTIQARLGHHSAAFTLDVYGGLFDSLDEELADKFDATAVVAETIPDADTADERIAPVLEFRLRPNGSHPTQG